MFSLEISPKPLKFKCRNQSFKNRFFNSNRLSLFQRIPMIFTITLTNEFFQESKDLLEEMLATSEFYLIPFSTLLHILYFFPIVNPMNIIINEFKFYSFSATRVMRVFFINKRIIFNSHKKIYLSYQIKLN